MKEEAIAAICHEAVRRYCKEIGDDTQKPWEEAPWRQKQSAIAGVVFTMRNPNAPSGAAHEQWVKQKVVEGWRYAPVKNEDEKLHPAILPYEGLPVEQKVKDMLFRSVVLSLTNGVNHV